MASNVDVGVHQADAKRLASRQVDYAVQSTEANEGLDRTSLELRQSLSVKSWSEASSPDLVD